MTVSRDYVLAGNATFTIEVPKALQKEHGYASHYTYQVEHVPATKQYPRESYFVKVLSGPDNTSDYTYLGMLDAFTGFVKRTNASKFPETSRRYKLLNRVLARIWSDDHEAYTQHGFDTHHEGKCGRCGRKLTTPTSVKLGIGPECSKIMGRKSA